MSTKPHVRDRSEEPNPIIRAVSTAIGRLRADEDMFELLTAFSELHPKAIEKIDVAAARANPTIADAVVALLRKKRAPTDPKALVPGVSARDVELAVVPGTTLPARIYTPDGGGPFPVVVYFHGGGWVIANKEVYDGGARGLCKEARAIVVSVDYRRAPEHKFPTAWDDAAAAYRWVTQNARSIGGDGLLFALAGESAGGNLALATAIAARDRGLVAPAHVLAVYPVTQTSLNTESYLENAIAQPLNRAMVEWFVDKLIRTPADLEDRRLQLIDADLVGLPPVTLINASIDPLRSDGAKMEHALRRADVSVERVDYHGVTHEFFGASAVVAKARKAQAYAGTRLRDAFAGS
ncbi:MAG TPA: alpha/beta hydrolase [Dokdonella sp.]